MPQSKPLVLRKVIKEFGAYYERRMSVELPDETEERKDQLRVSGFPYCSLRHLYKKLNRHTEVKKRGFGASFYTTVGTVTHEVIQEYLGLGGRMYGVWNCHARGCRGRREFSRNSKCPLCGSTMKYEEFTVQAFDHLSGHLDGIYRSESGHWFVVDYKTSSSWTIQNQKKFRDLPYSYNVAQIVAYCTLIERMLEIEISGWMLHYLARDSPARIHYTCGGLVTSKSKARELQKMKQWDEQYGIVSRVRSMKQIRYVIETKPCANLEQYEKEYKAFTACPLARSGVCFNPSLLEDTMSLSWEGYKEHKVYRLLPLEK